MNNTTKQHKRGNYIFLLLAVLLTIVLILLVFLGIGIWQEYKKAIIDNQKQQMLQTARSLGDNLEVLIEGYEEDLEGLFLTSGHTAATDGRNAWDVLQEYVDSHSPFVVDALLEDAQGRIVKSSHGCRVTDTYSTSQIDDKNSLILARLSDGEICLILKRELEDGRSLSLVLDNEAYYQALISSIRLGTNGYVVIKDSKGIILMHPEEKQWGINAISGRNELYPNKDLDSLEQMIESQNRGEEGVSEYYSYWWTDPELPRVKKISAYCPVFIGDDFLVVSAVIDYDDIYIPIAEGYLKLALVFAGIVAAVIFMAFYLSRLILQRQKDSEEIAYLTELNHLLEEMHQSEETIAHQQRLQIMGTMTGGIAHEFNNLLTPIMGYADLMLAELSEDSGLYDSASEIYQAAEKAKEIIQQISSLSRKNMETAYKNINAARMLQRAVKMVRSVCPAHVRLEDQIDLQDACILGNETQMNQVILNVCVNAIHAIGRQDGLLSVRAAVAARKELEEYHLSSVPDTWAQYVRIDIRDNGCGMGKDVLEQIFDPFFTTKKGGQGTGLGLALAEQIIHSHKGCIFAESEPGKGSTFHIYLPVNEQKQTAASSPAGDDEAQGFCLLGADGAQGFSLLVVDGNPKVLKLLEKNFTKLGISMHSCMTFEEAGSILKSQHIDALVAEQYIAGSSGLDFCMSIQGQYPGLHKLLMVDRITKETVEAKQRKVIDGYIDKPVSDTSILEALKALS